LILTKNIEKFGVKESLLTPVFSKDGKDRRDKNTGRFQKLMTGEYKK